MEKTLPRVLERVERAMIVSLFEAEPCVIYANPAMQQFLPGLHDDMPLADVANALEDVYSARRKPFGMRVIDQLHQPGDEASDHLKILGGIWTLGSHLPLIEAYPPCALLTWHGGDRFHEARAWRVHRPIAQASSLALEVDEAQRELEVGSQMIAQAHKRLGNVADTLVDYQQRAFDALVEEGSDD